MPIFTRFTKVVTYFEELSPIYLDDSSMKWSCKVTWQIKCIWSLLAGDLLHQTREGAVLLWEAPRVKATWPFDYVTKETSHDSLKKLRSHFHKTYGCLNLGANLLE